MRFLVDECTGPSVARWLRASGHDVFSVYDESPGADDSELIDRALREERILITNDKDFGEKVFREGKEHRGVILLRLSDERPRQKIATVRRVLEAYGNRICDRFVVATERSVRISGSGG